MTCEHTSKLLLFIKKTSLCFFGTLAVLQTGTCWEGDEWDRNMRQKVWSRATTGACFEIPMFCDVNQSFKVMISLKTP